MNPLPPHIRASTLYTHMVWIMAEQFALKNGEASPQNIERTFQALHRSIVEIVGKRLIEDVEAELAFAGSAPHQDRPLSRVCN